MFEWFYSIDVALFLFLNRTIANPVFDAAMPFLTSVRNWYPVYIIGALWLAIRGGKRGRIALLMLVITIVISDQVSSHLLKNWFGRIRPCDVVEGVRLISGPTGGFSFPSSHAVNNFAAATILSRFYPRFTWIFATLAVIVAFSRIYLGLHYPSDMAGGLLIGIGIGWSVATGGKLLFSQHLENQRENSA